MSIPVHIFSDAVHLGSFSSTADLVLTGGGTTANKIVFALMTTSASGGADATGCVINPGVDDIAMTRLTAHNMTRLGRPVSIWVFYDGLGGIPFPDGDITLRGTWANGSYRPQMDATLWGAADAVPPYSGDVSFVNPTNASSHSITVASNASNSKVVALAYCGGGLTITATAPTTLLDFSNTNGYAGLGVLTKEAAASVTLNWTTGSNDIVPRFGVSIDGTGAGDTTAPILSSPTGTATGSTTATVGATTNENNGTQYAVVTTSATAPSAAQIKAGQDHTGSAAAWGGSITISATGANTHSVTGLTASTGYYAHLIHTDAAANDSNIVTSAQFTTSAANAAPAWSGTPSAMSAKKGQALTTQDITSLVSDADLDTLSYSITGAPTGVTINSGTGVISGTPTAAPGVYACTVEADDGVNSPVSSSSFNITVQQATLALNAAGYEIGDGSAPATMAVDASVAWEIEVINDALPPVSVYHSDSVTTSAAGRLADISDDDLIYGTTYTVLGRRLSDGEWFAFTITAT